METRKLIKFGESSFVISVPQSWVSKHKLSKGDSVYLEEQEKGLIVNPNKEELKKEKRIGISATGKNINTIHREIISAYLNNYNMIEITGKDIVLKAKEITDFIRKLMSFEIIEQTSNKIIVKDFLNLKDISVQDIVRRMDIVTRAMIEDAKLCVKKDMCENIDYRDYDVNRFYYLIFRVIKGSTKNPNIAKILKVTQGELLDYYRLISSIEDVADCIKRIARSLRTIKLNPKKTKELLGLVDSCQNLYLEIMKAFYNKDKDLADKYSELGKELMIECNDFVKENRALEASEVVEKLKVIIKEMRTVARLILNMELDELQKPKV